MRFFRPLINARFSLFVTILSLFLIVAILVGTGITIINSIEIHQATTRIASSSFDTAIYKVNERRLAFTAPVYLMLQLLRSDPTFQQETDATKEAITQLVLPALKLNSQISAIYTAYRNGDYFFILSVPEAERAFIAHLGGPPATRFAIRDIRADPNEARVETWRFLDEDGHEIGAHMIAQPVFDPRVRGWYRDAMAHPTNLIRTPPYLFATIPQVGVTLASAFKDGVFGADITINSLLVYIRSVRPTVKQRYEAFDGNGLLLDPDPNEMFSRLGSGATQSIELATVDHLADPVVHKAWQIFKLRGPYRLKDFDVAGEEFLATVVRQVAPDGGVFYVLYAAPLSDFEGSLAGIARRNIFAALLVFLVSLPAIIYLARSISKPLARLSHEANLIQSFQLNDPITMSSRVFEINALTRSMSSMKSAIREVSKFVPKALVKDILENEQQVLVGGETRRVSILFTDVKDFTHIAERTSAEHLMFNMSKYFEELASVIIENKGTIDKFIGDAIFAFWNAPLPVAQHEQAACSTALKCRIASIRLNAWWIADGQPAWQTRFGVHVGEAVLGNVGSADRIDYTAIGDSVNVASRLEGLNKYYGTTILASGQIAVACANEFLFRRVDRILPKGAGHPLDVFELLGTVSGIEEPRATPMLEKLVSDWDEIYETYGSQDWLRALDALDGFAHSYPEDLVARIYIDRVIGFIVEPPPQDWDGVIRYNKK